MPDLEVPDSRGGSVSQASRASKFRQLDLNGDGVIDKAEWDRVGGESLAERPSVKW
jgi:hypothetical protein